MFATMPVFYDPVYTDGIDPTARFPRERYRRVAARLTQEDDGGWLTLRRPMRCSRDLLVLAHEPTYVDAFLEGRLDAKARRRIGLRPWTDQIVERTLRLTGGTIQALTEALRTGGYGANLAGGTHHAFGDQGGGYCVFNDLAIAARVAQRSGWQRVALIDLDVHQGDGTAAIFADDPHVFTLSVHCAKNYPLRKQRSTLDVALPEGTRDGAYLAAVEVAVGRVMDWRPDVVLFQAGVDALAADALGRLQLSRAGMRARNERVFDAVDAAGVPCVVAMGGGYADPIDASVEAFADLFLEAGRRHRARRRDPR